MLSILTKDNELVTSSLDIASQLGVEHQATLKVIDKYVDKLELFGRVRFEIQPFDTKGGIQKRKVYFLNQNQSIFLGTLSKNTEKVVNFKAVLTKAFEQAKQPVKSLTPLEMLKMAVVELEAKEKEIQTLALENTNLASRDIEVKTQKEYKWINKEIQNDRGRIINYYVRKYFLEGNSYRKAHKKAKESYRQATGCNLPDNVKNMSMEQKKDYLLFLSKLTIN